MKLILTAKQNPVFKRNEALSLKFVPMWWFGFWLTHQKYLPKANLTLSVFEDSRFIFYGRDDKGNAINKWVKELSFWIGDLSNLPANDYRVMEVDKRRKQLRFMGFCDCQFPIEYPLTLTNGVVLSGYEKVKYEDEKDYNEFI